MSLIESLDSVGGLVQRIATLASTSVQGWYAHGGRRRRRVDASGPTRIGLSGCGRHAGVLGLVTHAADVGHGCRSPWVGNSTNRIVASARVMHHRQIPVIQQMTPRMLMAPAQLV
jgi:hypothetical protein